MSSPGRRRRRTAGVVVAVVGAAVAAATVVLGWGHVPYGLGLAAVAIGCAAVAVTSTRHRVGRVVAGVAVGAVVVGGGAVAVTGTGGTMPSWERTGAVDLSGWSARTGDLLVSGGTAYDVSTGDVVWEVTGKNTEPVLVGPTAVVLDTGEETVAVETSTGRELWRAPVAGSGIATSGGVLVLSRARSDDVTEAVGLDLATGEVTWQRPGRPVMECDLGPVVRYSVAREQSHVLVVDGSNSSGAELVAVADGATSIADVDCSLSARVVDGVLLQGTGSVLAGRSLADGTQLWSTPVGHPWPVEGAGPVVVPADGAAGDAAGFTTVDVTTGAARRVTPPAGRIGSLTVTEPYWGPAVWVPVDLGAGAAVWDPASGSVVEIPGAESVDVINDVHSGWVAVQGQTRDLTGDASPQCWALSPEGELFGPAPGSGCFVDEGVLQAGGRIYPLQ